MNKKTFYYFPYKKKPPYMLYSEKDILNSKLFILLYNKIGDNSWKLRFRKNKIINFIVQIIQKTDIIIPTQNINLIYFGYNSILYFEFDKNNDVIGLYRKKNEKFEKSEFLGYSLDIFNIDELKKYEKILTRFLTTHWENLKKNHTSIHGDLVPSNICIKNEKVNLIDHNLLYSNSIAFDHLYFYAYSLKKLDERKNMDSTLNNRIKTIISNIVFSSIGEEDSKLFLTLIEKLEIINTPFPDFDNYVKLFLNNFSNWTNNKF